MFVIPYHRPEGLAFTACQRPVGALELGGSGCCPLGLFGLLSSLPWAWRLQSSVVLMPGDKPKEERKL